VAISTEPRILIVDDHEIVRDGIRNLVSRARPGWKICGVATNGKQAIQAVEELKPDLVILDITMPVMNGLEAASRISKSGANARILIFTMHESAVLGEQIRQTGAQGFVAKSDAARNLILAIETILAGGKFFGSAPGPESSGRAVTRFGFSPCLPFKLSSASSPRDCFQYLGTIGFIRLDRTHPVC